MIVITGHYQYIHDHSHGVPDIVTDIHVGLLTLA